MARSTQLRVVVGVLVVAVALAGMAGTTVAQSDQPVEVSFETAYDGTSGDGSQAITVTGTFTSSAPVTNLSITFIEGGQGFIDYSEDFRKNDVPTGVEVIGEDGDFRVPQLESGEQFSITFTAYPKRLDRAELRVAAYRLSAENPQGFEDEGFVSADLSDSPYRQYQEVSLFADFGLLGFVGAVVLGLVGLLAAGVLYRQRDSKAESVKRDVVDDLRSLRNRVDKSAARNQIDDLIARYSGGGRPSPAPDERETGTGSGSTGGDGGRSTETGDGPDSSGDDKFEL